MKTSIFFLLINLIMAPLHAQQVADLEFNPKVSGPPLYQTGKGPVVLVDEAHHNFHTIGGRYKAFAKLLTSDGYRVRGSKDPLSEATLNASRIFVISNAIHPDNDTLWALPVRSAFTKAEIGAVEKWVREGGSLFLIADHMPLPGAAGDLAKAFGFTFYNGFASDTTLGLYPGTKRELDIFTRDQGTLGDHIITRGNSANELITRVATFTGQAFEIPPAARSLLTFDERFKILLPDTAWRFNQHTRRHRIDGFSQGAVLEYGKGRIAVFGEAAMFTAQLKGKGVPFGLNSPDASQNAQFLLNLVHWLDGKL